MFGWSTRALAAKKRVGDGAEAELVDAEAATVEPQPVQRQGIIRASFSAARPTTLFRSMVKRKEKVSAIKTNSDVVTYSHIGFVTVLKKS
jgi:hypothetical protein